MRRWLTLILQMPGVVITCSCNIDFQKLKYECLLVVLSVYTLLGFIQLLGLVTVLNFGYCLVVTSAMFSTKLSFTSFSGTPIPHEWDLQILNTVIHPTTLQFLPSCTAMRKYTQRELFPPLHPPTQIAYCLEKGTLGILFSFIIVVWKAIWNGTISCVLGKDRSCHK